MEGALKFYLGCNPLTVGANNNSQNFDFTLESHTVDYDIDLRPHLNALVDSYLLELGNVEGLVREPGGRYLAPLIAESRQCFERLVGRKPSSVPIFVHVWVIAESKELDTSTIAHDFLIDVPTKTFKERLNRKYPESKLKPKPQVPGRDPGNFPVAS